MYSKETTLYRAIVIAAVIIGSILLYFMLSVIKQQKRYRKLNSQKLEGIISSIENERSRIASDMHDELGPILSSIKLRLSGIDSLSECDRNNLNTSMLQIDGIIKKVRGIAYNFTPSVLKHKGFLFAVRHYIEHYIEDTGLQVTLDSPIVPLSQSFEIHIYRILQEIIYNTVKHAKATKLQITLSVTNHNFTILSCDNGVGFDYNQARNAGTGHGLQSLHTRTEMLAGEMDVQSKPGRGTRFHIQFPLNRLNQTECLTM